MRALVFGNLTLDINSYGTRIIKSPGGSSFFASKILRSLGVDVKIISPRGRDFPESELKNARLLPQKPARSNTLAFKNDYSDKKIRTQSVENLSASEYEPDFLTSVVFSGVDLVIVAPVVNNFPDGILEEIAVLGRKSLKVLQPQGLFRKIDRGIVSFADRIIPEKVIKGFDVIVVSEKDHPEISRLSGIWSKMGLYVIITRSGKPALLFDKGKFTKYPAFEVKSISDETGAGDIFAASFAYAYAKSRDAGISMKFAHGSAALSLPLSSTGIKYGYGDIKKFAEKNGVKINL